MVNIRKPLSFECANCKLQTVDIIIENCCFVF